MFGIDQTTYPPVQFALFRMYAGLYLVVTFGMALYSAEALWSVDGLVGEASNNMTYGVFPNVLNVFDSPLEIQVFLVVYVLLAGLFMLGIQRNVVALMLWYGLACLLNRNNLILNPSLLYLGWILLACSLIPAGEPWSFGKSKRLSSGWEMPGLLLAGCWLLFALGYSLSGVDKLQSESWVTGTAIAKIMGSPLGKPWNTGLLDTLPAFFFTALNYIVILFEVLCLPLAFFERTRKYAWLLVTIVQLGILIFLQVETIFFGMMALHLFLFDVRWLDKT